MAILAMSYTGGSLVMRRKTLGQSQKVGMNFDKQPTIFALLFFFCLFCLTLLSSNLLLVLPLRIFSFYFYFLNIFLRETYPSSWGSSYEGVPISFANT